MSISADRQHLAFAEPMRASLMMLGIFLHAANVHAPGDPWLVQSQDTPPVFAGIRDIIHTFRMPAFFFISGILLTISLGRRPVSEVRKSRMQRLVIPLLVTMILINLPFHLSVNYLSQYVPTITFQELNKIQYHMWFIVYLIIYIQIYSMLRHWIRGYCKSQAVIPLLMVYYFVIQAILSATGNGFEEWPLIASPYQLLYYFGFFLAGTQSLSIMADRHNVLGQCVFWGCVLLMLTLVPDFGQGHYLEVFLRNVSQIISVCLCIYGIVLLFSYLPLQGSRLVAQLSDASYSIYIVHHPLVVLFSLMCLSWPISGFAKYGFVVVTTFIVSWALHHLVIARSPLMLYLFNGRPLIRNDHTDSAYRGEKA